MNAAQTQSDHSWGGLVYSDGCETIYFEFSFSEKTPKASQDLGLGLFLFLFKFKTAARLMEHILKVVIQGNKVVGQMDLSWNILLSFLTWSFWMRFVKF